MNNPPSSRAQSVFAARIGAGAFSVPTTGNAKYLRESCIFPAINARHDRKHAALTAKVHVIRWRKLAPQSAWLPSR